MCWYYVHYKTIDVYICNLKCKKILTTCIIFLNTYICGIKVVFFLIAFVSLDSFLSLRKKILLQYLRFIAPRAAFNYRFFFITRESYTYTSSFPEWTLYDIGSVYEY